jgi:hypothetical protein
MSTKTLRKRIALVAVSALTAGLVSVVAVPSANAATGDISFNATLATALPQTGATAGVCTVGLGTAASPSYITVGGSQTVVTAVDTSIVAGWGLSITGPAVWSGSASQTISSKSSDLKTITTAVEAATALSATMAITGTGPIQVSIVSAAGAVVATKYFIGVTSCVSGPNLGRSFVAAEATYNGSLASNVDASAALSVPYTAAGQYSYINYTLNNSYGVALTAASLTGSSFTATVTGGCKIGFGTGSAGVATGSTLAVASNGASTYKFGVTVIGDNTPRVCVATVNFDGAALITKTITMQGDVAKVSVDTANSSTNLLKSSNSVTNGLCYKAYDSAGTLVTPTYANFSHSGTGAMAGAAIANGTTYTAAAMLTYGFACITPTPAALFGAGTWTLNYSRASDGATVSSDAGNVMVANSGTAAFSASWDKASYNLGDVATLTIKPIDTKGNAVADGVALTGLVISVGGATQLGTAYAATDTTSGGAKKYKFAIGSNTGQFAYSVTLTSLSAQADVTGTYSAVSSSTGVTNADVLKAIVSLIASINKQIAALQKALLKR